MTYLSVWLLPICVPVSNGVCVSNFYCCMCPESTVVYLCINCCLSVSTVVSLCLRINCCQSVSSYQLLFVCLYVSTVVFMSLCINCCLYVSMYQLLSVCLYVSTVVVQYQRLPKYLTSTVDCLCLCINCALFVQLLLLQMCPESTVKYECCFVKAVVFVSNIGVFLNI